MQLCHCGQPAVVDGLCKIHFLHNVWQTNTDVDHLGIILFFKKVIPKAFKSFKYGIPFFHREILWEAIRDVVGWKFFDRQIVVAAPRGSSKTTLLSKGLALYCAVFAIKKYIVLASKTGRAAQKNLRWIRGALGSSSIIAFFGDLRTDSKSKTQKTGEVEGKWTSELLILRNGVTIECVGMGQQLRSAAEGEDVNRVDLFIADDTETDENTKTPDRRETNETWFFDTVLPSLDVDTGTVVFINTLTHSESILSKLLKSDGWRKKFYQITSTNDAGEEISLWPEKFPVPLVHAIRRNYEIIGRERGFYKEYYNIIKSEKGFDEAWIRYYNLQKVFREGGRNWIVYKEPGQELYTTTPAYLTLGIDLSYSYNEKSNFTVLLPLATIFDHKRFILPYSRGRYTTYDDFQGGKLIRKGFVDEALRLHEKYCFDAIVIDTSGTQKGGLDVLKDAFSGVAKLPRIEGFRTTEEKFSRLRGLLEPEYQIGRIHHLPWMDDLKREMISLGDTTDDILDALYLAILKASAPEDLHYDRAMLSAGAVDALQRPSREVARNWMVL